ncbi:MAG: family phage terminase small subunit [Bryobacterales bacterium]|jgi:P27 family predicted phage terminase small subunit|nr:family phage terminase small subunit [Bryobacterales bacterium]
MTGKRKSGKRKKLESGRAPDQPTNLPGIPCMPPGLPARAQEEWVRVVDLLQKRGDLSELDQTAIADYTLCLARLDNLEADITARGELIDGERGKVKNPSIQLAREYRASLMKWADALGLTPASRSRMTLPEPGATEDDDLLD